MPSDDGPRTFADYLHWIKNLGLPTSEEAYNEGVAEGRRYERADKLLEVAKAAMPELQAEQYRKCAGQQMGEDWIATQAFRQAAAMLAEEADRRNHAQNGS